MEGKIVNHKIFGEGAVVSLKDNFLTVKFQNEEKIFICIYDAISYFYN